MQRSSALPHLLIGLLVCCAVVIADDQDKQSDDDKPQVDWLIQHEQAVEQSRKTGRPILAYFTGSDWCEWCAKLDRQVFETPVFARWAAEHVVLLKLDFPEKKKQSKQIRKQNAELKDRYHIKGFPTVLLLDAGGKVLAKTGFRPGGAEKWTDHASHLLKNK